MTILKIRGEDGKFIEVPSIIGPRGAPGDRGNGILNIEKVSTENDIDRYKILYDNGDESYFSVTNGKTPVVGVDYWTESDKNYVIESVLDRIHDELNAAQQQGQEAKEQELLEGKW